MRGSGVEYPEDAALYEKHAEDLIRYAAVLVGPAEAGDVVSAVVLRVLARKRLSDLDDPRAYLFRVDDGCSASRATTSTPHRPLPAESR